MGYCCTTTLTLMKDTLEKIYLFIFQPIDGHMIMNLSKDALILGEVMFVIQ